MVDLQVTMRSAASIKAYESTSSWPSMTSTPGPGKLSHFQSEIVLEVR